MSKLQKSGNQQENGLSRRQFLGNSSAVIVSTVAASSLPFGSILTNAQELPILHIVNFTNWSEGISVPGMLAAEVTSAEEIVTLANWASVAGRTLRPFGHKHGWSPLVITKDTKPDDNVVLIDTSKLDAMTIEESHSDYGTVRVGTGATVEDLYLFLEDRGWAFQNTPAPGQLSIGGVLAIDAHGTGVPYDGSTESPHLAGSMSNLVLSFEAVVWDDDKEAYAVTTFSRNHPDADALLAHLGRTIITEVVLQVVPNYFLRCVSRTDIKWRDVFDTNRNDSPFCVSNLLDKYGRVEVIWYPYTKKPWLKYWENTPEPPEGSRVVFHPYNYAFSDSLPQEVSDYIKKILEGHTELVPLFSKAFYLFTVRGLKGLVPPYDQSHDIWGSAWNLLVYIKDSTLRVTANGYVIHVARSKVRTVVRRFAKKYNQLLNSYQENDKYPMAGPVEVRVTGLEDVTDLHVDGNLKPPSISALTKSMNASGKVDTAVWFDILTFPGQPDSNEFYQEIEQWFLDNYDVESVRCEWSKGWAYTNEGAWTNEDYLHNTIPQAFAHTPRSWDSTKEVLNKYDPKGIYTNPFLLNLFEQTAKVELL